MSTDLLADVLLGLHAAEEPFPACVCAAVPSQTCPAYPMSARYHHRRARLIVAALTRGGHLTERTAPVSRTPAMLVDILRMIAAKPGVLGSDISATLGVTDKRVHRWLVKAETAGWIKRPRRPDGTRPLCITAAGEVHLAELAGGAQ